MDSVLSRGKLFRLALVIWRILVSAWYGFIGLLGLALYRPEELIWALVVFVSYAVVNIAITFTPGGRFQSTGLILDGIATASILGTVIYTFLTHPLGGRDLLMFIGYIAIVLLNALALYGLRDRET